MFTILIKQEGEAQFIGSVKEMPLMGKLSASSSETLISRFKKEINYLIKDRDDLRGVDIKVELAF